jgi:hypothetical protein
MTRGPVVPPRKSVKAMPAVARPGSEEQHIVSVLRGMRGLQEKVRKLRRGGAR